MPDGILAAADGLVAGRPDVDAEIVAVRVKAGVDVLPDRVDQAADRRLLVRNQGHEVRLVSARHDRSEEHTSELQSLAYLVCRLLLEKKKKKNCDDLCDAVIYDIHDTS